MLVRDPIDFAPGAAAANPDGAGLRIDVDVLQRREVDHDAVVARPQSGAVVTAAADGEEQVVVACERDRHGHVGRTCALRDQRRPLVDHRVVDRARRLVVGVFRPDQPSPEAGELLARGACWCRDGAHTVLLCRTTSSWIRNNSAPFVDGCRDCAVTCFRSGYSTTSGETRIPATTQPDTQIGFVSQRTGSDRSRPPSVGAATASAELEDESSVRPRYEVVPIAAITIRILSGAQIHPVVRARLGVGSRP